MATVLGRIEEGKVGLKSFVDGLDTRVRHVFGIIVDDGVRIWARRSHEGIRVLRPIGRGRCNETPQIVGGLVGRVVRNCDKDGC